MHDLSLSSPIDGMAPISEAGRLSVAETRFDFRWSLRIRDEHLELACRNLDLNINTPLLRAAETGEAVFLRLSPDEWLVLGREHANRIMARLEGEHHAAVDITHRQFGLTISGSASEIALAAFCPLDLSMPRFPVGTCTRTVFARSEITLWRTGLGSFHLEAWRSYADYIMKGLQLAAKDIRYFAAGFHEVGS